MKKPNDNYDLFTHKQDKADTNLIAVEIGDNVTVLPHDLSSLGMPHRQIEGGKGTLMNTFKDNKGTVYAVCLNGRVRFVRREGLQSVSQTKSEKTD